MLSDFPVRLPQFSLLFERRRGKCFVRLTGLCSFLLELRCRNLLLVYRMAIITFFCDVGFAQFLVEVILPLVPVGLSQFFVRAAVEEFFCRSRVVNNVFVKRWACSRSFLLDFCCCRSFLLGFQSFRLLVWHRKCFVELAWLS